MQIAATSSSCERLPEGLGLETFKKVDAVVVDAVELVAALHGAPHVDLQGFGKRHDTPFWTHPAIAHVAVADSAREAVRALMLDARRSRGFAVLAAAVIAIGAACGGALIGALATSPTPGEHVGLSWTAQDVSSSGLGLATPAGRIVVPPGGKLPNGDVLLAVHPERRIAVLSSGSLVLHERKEKP